MPETPDYALDAVAVQNVLETSHVVQSTGANLSKYRAHLLPITQMHHSWVGMVVTTAKQTLEDAFYPLMRVEKVDLPTAEKLGRLHDVLLLKTASFLDEHMVNPPVRTGGVVRMFLVTPAPLPVADCPITQQNCETCNACPAWAHCATWRLPLGHAYPIKIAPFHFEKVCGGFTKPSQGAVLKGLSFRVVTYGSPAGPLTGRSLLSLPQFLTHFS